MEMVSPVVGWLVVGLALLGACTVLVVALSVGLTSVSEAALRVIYYATTSCWDVPMHDSRVVINKCYTFSSNGTDRGCAGFRECIFDSDAGNSVLQCRFFPGNMTYSFLYWPNLVDGVDFGIFANDNCTFPPDISVSLTLDTCIEDSDGCGNTLYATMVY